MISLAQHLDAFGQPLGHAGFMEPQRQSEILATIPRGVQRAKLEEEIRQARQRGYATSRGEILVGAVAVSAPNYDHRGSVVGSVGVYGPSARIDEPKMLEYFNAPDSSSQNLNLGAGHGRWRKDRERSAITREQRDADINDRSERRLETAPAWGLDPAGAGL